MRKILYKLFYETRWVVYYRKTEKPFVSNSDCSTGKWHKVDTKKRFWCADPFIIRDNANFYLFCETMDIKKSRGLVGIGKLNPDGDTTIEKILDLGCHVSYPNVFKYGDSWYMIPETSARKTIELYRSTSFPYEWEKVSDLVENIHAVDSTVHVTDDGVYVYIYEPNGKHNELSRGKIDFSVNRIVAMEKLITYDDKIGRPAGGFVEVEDNLYRPTQYGSNYYGEKIVIYKVPDADSEEYYENNVFEIDQTYCKDDLFRKVTGTHTYGWCDGIEIIDKKYSVFDLLRPIRLLFKKLRVGGYR